MSVIMMTDSARIASALSYVPADDRDMWVKMGQAIKSELSDDEAFDIWNNWSQSADSYNEQDAKTTWRSIKPGGGIGIGTLFREAKGNGWPDNGVKHIRTPAEIAQRAADRASKDAADRIKDTTRYARGAVKAMKLWTTATPASADHPYLVLKQVASVETIKTISLADALAILGYAPHQDGDLLAGPLLVIPVKIGEAISTCELIDGEGRKHAIKDGEKAGGYWAAQRLPEGDGTGLTLAICEGVSTTLSVVQATAHHGIAALANSNMPKVAKTMRDRYPEAVIVLAADLNRKTGAPDRHAIEAAAAVGGLLAVPDFGPDREEGQTDFNDMAVLFGLEAVKTLIDGAMPGAAGGAEPVQAPQARTKRKSRISPDSITCEYGGGTFDVSGRGVFFIGKDKDGNEVSPKWVCSPLAVVAKTRDAKSGEWGRLLEWRDDDQVRHQWAMPLELLQTDGADMRKELARMGLAMAPAKASRDLLASFLQVWPVEARARCVERLGWHGPVYVTPSESIGQDDEIVVFQNAHAIEPAFSSVGTLEEWRESVAMLAAGNSRLVFALSVAFAGALADVAGEDSGGFHLRGGSSSGKTTALKVAASVWGNPTSYPRLWRATANGLEGLAALHNDGLLILDELSQIDPKEAGEAAYLLANGQGKARASRTGAARQSARWRLLFLSAGEESLTALMARAGRKANAGQEIRLADIDADAGAGMGAFEVLHDQPSPAALALAIKDAATRFHGAVGLAWLRGIVADRPRLADIIEDGIRQFVQEVATSDAAGQVLRVARRFALVAVAGELATHYGLTGWEKDESINAARKCFAAWLEAFGGTGNREERAMLSQVRAFFETHGASRFEDMNTDKEQRIINRAGFYRTGASGDREFLVLPETFKRDICQGYDARTMTLALVAAGWLEPGKDGKTAQKPRVPGIGPTRCYVFTARMWEGD